MYQPGEDEVIKDPLLHWAIRASMGAIQSKIKMTPEVVGDKSVRDISFEQCAHPEDFEGEEWAGKPFWIENLEGLQYATSARMIDIAYTSSAEGKRIADLSPLAGLTQLETLILKQNGIDDISPLNGLSNLTTLDVSANQLIEDISAVSGMTSLKSLNASFNKVNSIEGLSELENLEYIAVSNNNISTLPDLSKLTKMYFLDISHNQLTDVSEIAKMKNLQQLNLSGNTGITDITPLASLLKLEKDSTTLPDESKKEDLFAAIEVNKLFNLFNISKMTERDIENVQNALTAYDALTDVQKTYFEAARIEAARSNLEKVKNGMEPDYYPEYDVEGEKLPIFNSIEIKVVDKKGVPLAGVSFDKISKNAYAESTSTVTTNSVGTFLLKHTSMDPVYDEIIVRPSGETYVSDPEYITYTVAWGNTTATVNGQPATGLEELVFTLVPADEYVDKSALKDAIAETEKVERAAKYTKESYQTYETALAQAQTCLENVDATDDDVAAAIEALDKAITGLVKADVLTELKLIVKDVNGNVFHREFKFQVRIPVTKKEAYNVYSEPESGALYMQTLPTWQDGKEWEILPCYDEAYEMTPVTVSIGVTDDGQRYFKTVDGKAVDVDFEKEVVVTHLVGVEDVKRKPDSQVLEALLAEMEQINTAKYTTSTAQKLLDAIADAKAVLEKESVLQEDYNAAIAALKKAKAELKEAADKKELQKEMNRLYYYSAETYTESSWEPFEITLWEAEAVLADGDATQQEVDDALTALLQAEKALVQRADKKQLKALLEEAELLNENDYQSGFEALKDAIKKAETVYNNVDATQEEVDAKAKVLQEAMDALVKKPVEANYACDPGVFRAKVTDAKGNPVAGVVFESVIDGAAEKDKLISNNNGIIIYYVYGQNRGKTTYIRLADENYTTEDEHYFVADGMNDWIVSMTSIDGKAYEDGTKLTYVVRKVGEEPVDPPSVVNKNELNDQISLASSYEGKASDYTEDSYQAFTDAFLEAKRVSGDEDATQDTVDQATKALKEARENLVAVEKPEVPEQPEVKPFEGTVTLSAAKFIYNGNVRKPTVTVKDTTGNQLVAGTDYKVTYGTGRKNVGRYSVKVTFIGNYTGTVTKYFTIVPKAVTNLKSIRYQYGNQVRLTWTKSTGATGYRVYVKKSSASKYTYLGATKNAYYTKGSLAKNTAYRFKVIPYYKTSTGTTQYYSDNAYKTTLINTVAKGNKLVQVTGVKVAKSGTKVKVSWKNVGYETGYQISRSTSKTGTNIVVTYKTTSGKSKVIAATKNKTYYYKVRAYRVVNGKKIFGMWSNPVKFTRK